MSDFDLVLVLGDQLDRQSAALRACRPGYDRVLMIEARGESTRIASHRARSALFLAAMRQHAGWLREQGHALEYIPIDAPHAAELGGALGDALARLQPRRVVMVEAGEYAVQAAIAACCATAGIALEVLPDSHFLCSRADFANWRSGRRNLVMEHFYRHMRRRLGILVDGDQPAGGRWNFDQSNRRAFGREGPGMLPARSRFAADATTRGALDDVARLFPDNPGALSEFAWPVTREQALTALRSFVEQRLAAFGPFQDAMWQGEPWLYHAHLSAALNLKLLDPREVLDAVLDAWRAGRVPLASVEGLVRQLIGWREYVRGVYWSEMPDYLSRNALQAERPLPAFYWHAGTDMACLREVIGQTLQHGYAHHIQRLMVTGLFALLHGVRPQAVHEWYLAVYVDAVEWVEAPNTLGMSQYADGGLLASKPYVASGRYIDRMSNYCRGCRYDPVQALGGDACPFTTLYWDFLARHAERFDGHPRAGLQWRNLQRVDDARLAAIRRHAGALRDAWDTA